LKNINDATTNLSSQLIAIPLNRKYPQKSLAPTAMPLVNTSTSTMERSEPSCNAKCVSRHFNLTNPFANQRQNTTALIAVMPSIYGNDVSLSSYTNVEMTNVPIESGKRINSSHQKSFFSRCSQLTSSLDINTANTISEQTKFSMPPPYRSTGRHRTHPGEMG
jgi:hypothetical protein